MQLMQMLFVPNCALFMVYNFSTGVYNVKMHHLTWLLLGMYIMD